MQSKVFALKISRVVLFLLGLMDFNRGIAHTFRVHYAATELAQIDPHPDALVLMSAFGMSNFLTGALFILISLKAKRLAPVTLLLIPAAYFVGGVGMHYSQVTLQSPFIGQYVMRVYLGICLVTAAAFFVSAGFEKFKRGTRGTIHS